MGILNLKDKTIHKFIKKKLKRKVNSFTNASSKIKTVGLIVSTETLNILMLEKSLHENFNIDKNKFKIVLFQNTEDKLEEDVTYSKKSFGLFGKIKDNNLKEFVETPFDLLINYCTEEVFYSQVVASESKAKFKIGLENKYASFYNLSIDIEENKIDTLNKEIVKYLRILNLL